MVDSCKTERSFSPPGIYTLLCCDFLFLSSRSGIYFPSFWFWNALGNKKEVEVMEVPSLGLKKPYVLPLGILLEDERPHGTEKSYAIWGHPRPASPQNMCQLTADVGQALLRSNYLGHINTCHQHICSGNP